MKISKLYGMRIESSTKKKKGYVIGACFEGDKIQFLQCYDEGEREFFVSVDRIIYLDERIIFEDEAQKLKRTKILKLGRGTYSESGKFLGVMSDCEIQNFCVKTAFIGKRKINFGRITCGDINIVKDVQSADKCEQEGNAQKILENEDALFPHEMFIRAICT